MANNDGKRRRKLVVFDLDGTLVDARVFPINRRHGLGGCTIDICGTPLFVYLRPHVRTVLQICRGDPSMTVVLYSAGTTDYVHSVIENVIFPVMDETFYFDAIYTKYNVDQTGGIKRMDLLKADFHADAVLLVDDLLTQCIGGAELYGAMWFHIKGFYAEEEGSENDKELFEVLKHPFFY